MRAARLIALPIVLFIFVTLPSGNGRAAQETDTTIIWSFTIHQPDGLSVAAVAGTYAGPFFAILLDKGSDHCQQEFVGSPTFSADYTSGSISATLACPPPWPASFPVTVEISDMNLTNSGHGSVKTESGPQRWRWMNFDGGTTASGTIVANTLRVTEIAGKGITGGEWPAEDTIDESVDADAFIIDLPGGARFSAALFARARDGVTQSVDLRISYWDSGTTLCQFNDRLDAAELSRTSIDFATGAVSFSAIPCSGSVPGDVSLSIVADDEYWRMSGTQVNADGTRTHIKLKKYNATASGAIGSIQLSSSDNVHTNVGERVTR